MVEAVAHGKRAPACRVQRRRSGSGLGLGLGLGLTASGHASAVGGSRLSAAGEASKKQLSCRAIRCGLPLKRFTPPGSTNTSTGM
eukprot:scaffold126381_cov54-Phaeocystis_antarctica.AAC.2